MESYAWQAKFDYLKKFNCLQEHYRLSLPVLILCYATNKKKLSHTFGPQI